MYFFSPLQQKWHFMPHFCIQLFRILFFSNLFEQNLFVQPAPTDIPAFSIWYLSIRSISDLWLNIQTASHFLRSSLVDHLDAKGVYFCSFVTKSNEVCTKIHPNSFNSFYRTVIHVYDFSRPQVRLAAPHQHYPPTYRQLKHYKVQN